MPNFGPRTTPTVFPSRDEMHDWSQGDWLAALEAVVVQRDEALRSREEMAVAMDATEATLRELRAERDEFGSDRLSLQQQISEVVSTARREQVRADAAEADAEVRKRLYEASVKDRARLREALQKIANGDARMHLVRIARDALGEDTA